MPGLNFVALMAVVVGLILPTAAVSIPRPRALDLPAVNLPDTPPPEPFFLLNDPADSVFPPPDPITTIPSNSTQVVNGTQIEKRQVVGPHIWTTSYQQPLDFFSYIKVNGEGYTLGGSVFVGIYRASDQALLFSLTRTAGGYPGFAGGSFGVETGVVDCNKSWPTLPQIVNSYAAAYDWSTHTWGPVAWVHTGC
jgi:hypothetical protein